MKRLFLFLFYILWFAPIKLCAENVFSLQGSDGKPGDVITVTANLAVTDDIVAAEFSIQLDDNLTYVENSCAFDQQRLSNHTTKVVKGENKLSVLIFSSALKSLPKGSSELFTFQLKLGNAPKQYTLLPIAKVSNNKGEAMPVTLQEATITIKAAKMTVVQDSLDFGHIPVRATYNKKITFKNEGTIDLQIDAIENECSELSFGTSFPVTIQPGKSVNVPVVYAPQLKGKLSTLLTVRSNAVNDIQDIVVLADPYYVNELYLSQASGINGEVVTINLGVKNMEYLSAFQCTILVPEELEFQEGSFKGTSRSKSFQAISSMIGDKLNLYLYNLDTNAYIADGSGRIGTLQFKLSGKSGTYKLQPEHVVLGNLDLENACSAVRGGSVSISSPSLQCPSALEMQPVAVTETLEEDFPISNNGTVTLTIDRVDFIASDRQDSRFYVINNLPMVLDPGETKSLVMRSQRAIEGSYEETMQIYSDDPEKPVKSVAVTGDVLTPNTLSVTKSFSKDKSACTLVVDMQNASDISAVQFTIRGLEALSPNSSSVVLSERAKNHRSIVTANADGSTNVVLYSLQNKCIEGRNGKLMTMSFILEGENRQVTGDVSLENVILCSVNSKNLATESVAKASRHLINLTLGTVDEVKDKTRVVFNEEKSEVYDMDCDALKFMSISSNVLCQLFSIGDDGTCYSINERPFANGLVPLGVITSQDCDLVINATRMDYPVMLQDRLLKVEYDLSKSGYSFACAKGTFKDRFVLRALLPGDVNGDSRLTVADVTCLIAILNGSDFPDSSVKSADVDNNGIVDTNDLQQLVELISNSSY